MSPARSTPGLLARLAEYDRRNGAQPVSTLSGWLESFGDVGAAAAATFTHPNTSATGCVA
jgi:DNA-binding PucR family transcriptional regulator